MRISTSYQYLQNLAAIDASTEAASNAQEVVSTGKQINQLSDNPYGAMDAITMDGMQSQLSQFASNLSTAKDYLETNENAFSQVTTLLQQAYQLAVQGGNSTTGQTAMQNLASQVADIQSSLVSIANTQNSTGQYVFAGQQTDTQPFSVDNGTLTYLGDNNNISIEVAPGNNMVVNTPGSSVFTPIYQQLQQLQSDLSSGNVSAISNTDIANLQSSMSNVSDLNGQFGAQVDTVNNLTSDNTQRATDLTSSISNVVNANMAQAVVNLTSSQNAYEAALEATSVIGKYSLVDFLTGT